MEHLMAGIEHDEKQALAIETKAPAVLVMAGAGTGKSSVTLRRIQHLLNSGVSPSKITVASLSNAEAARISALFPENRVDHGCEDDPPAVPARPS